MRFLDFFSGIGGFRLGMEMAGHECAGHCEIDKFADKSYRAMHNVRESEWYANDIRNVEPGDLPEVDCYCGGFPCQSFSIAGKRGGFEDTRGTLFFEVMRLAAVRKPKYLFLENVAGLLSHDGGKTFGTILNTLGELGYWYEYQVLNSKDFGVPQNRERVFIVGHLGGFGGRKVFPIEPANGKVDSRYISTAIDANYFKGIDNHGARTAVMTLNTRDENGKEPPQQDRVYNTNGLMTALSAQLNGRYNIEVRAVLTPDREEKRQNGRRIKNDGEPMFTLTAQDKHGVMITEATKQGYAKAFEGDSINLAVPGSETRRGRVGVGVVNTLDTSCNQGTLVNGRIRRLTPRECFRLQGFPNEYFLRASAVNSDSQLYKQAGNSVTVNVIHAIASRL